jgi:FlaA1/EpsC-like NDP-sugar epimerase
VSFYAAFWVALVFIFGAVGVPRSVALINWLTVILLIGGSRMAVRWWFSGVDIQGMTKQKLKRHIVIYGAGIAGIQLASVLDYSKEYKLVAFIDDS